MSIKQLVVGASGIYLSYLSISVISERLYNTMYPSIKDPEQSHKFIYPGLLVWFSGLLCALFGWVKGKTNRQAPNPIPLGEQLLLGFLFTANMLCANYALLYIDYLEQALGRNSRYLMVVLIGAFFSRVKKGSDLKLPPKKILVAAVITGGVLVFTFYGHSNKHGSSHRDESQAWKGYVLLIVSITADALFSDSQAYSKHWFKPTANHLFTSANFFTFLFVLMFSFISGEGFEQIHFCINHPTVIIDLFVMGVLQVLGQISIYYVIVNFKQHMFPLISTTRKVFSVFLSIIIFGHVLNGMQWLGILLVFVGLGYELKEELQGKKNKGEEKDAKSKQPLKVGADKNVNVSVEQQNKDVSIVGEKASPSRKSD